MPQGSCLTCIIFEGPVTLDDVEWMYSFHVLTMSSIQEQQYFVTELFTPSNFSPFFLLFLLFDLILYFSVAVAQEWIFFFNATFSFPPFSTCKPAADGSAPGVTGGPLQLRATSGLSSAGQGEFTCTVLSTPFYLKAEIKVSTLNKTEGHLEM